MADNTAQAADTSTPIDSVVNNVYAPAVKSAEKFSQDTDAGIKKMDSEKLPPPPEMKAAPNAKDYQTNPMETYGSAAMFLATFGSLLTKHPLTSALNSGAAVMNAAQKKDSDSFNNALKQWKNDR